MCTMSYTKIPTHDLDSDDDIEAGNPFFLTIDRTKASEIERGPDALRVRNAARLACVAVLAISVAAIGAALFTRDTAHEAADVVGDVVGADGSSGGADSSPSAAPKSVGPAIAISPPAWSTDGDIAKVAKQFEKAAKEQAVESYVSWPPPACSSCPPAPNTRGTQPPLPNTVPVPSGTASQLA